MLRGMGFELERAVAHGDEDADLRQIAAGRRWQLACERFAAASDACRALRGRIDTDDPAWISAQLRLAEARRLRHDAAEELERQQSELDDDLWR
jgi:hypothetical protein